ncbi:MAG: hypothetical protein L0Z68_05340 [Gammaproteobacteria bacterium]|nr:hypothetical protein [Gammaproteobacteria bacterium]
MRREIIDVIDEKQNIWCPFHWFEGQFLLPSHILPVHMFVYGSLLEMRAVEHDSVYREFLRLLGEDGVEANMTTPTERLRQRLADVWRLRACLIEAGLAPPEMKAVYLRMADKATGYVERSYGFNCDQNVLNKGFIDEVRGERALRELISLTEGQLGE